jgi:hypothetical protein
VTFTNIRFSLVATAMVVPTDAYDNRASMTAEQAAARVVRALEERPVTWDTVAGRVGEVVNIVAPRVSDALMARFHRSVPDSDAARGGSEHQHRRDDAGGDDGPAEHRVGELAADPGADVAAHD